MIEIQIMKGEDKKNQKSLVITLLELILINRILMNMKNFVGYKSTSKNQTKKSLIDDLSKRLLELEFKPNHSIKSKSLKWVVKNILPTI